MNLNRPLIITGVVALVVGIVAGYELGHRQDKTFSDVTSGSSSVQVIEKERLVTVEKPTTKVVTKIEYRDGPVRERIVEREVTGEKTTTATKDTKVNDDLHVQQSTKLVTSSDPHFIGSATYNPITKVPGGMLQFRPLGPIWLGVALNTKLEPTISVGVQW